MFKLSVGPSDAQGLNCVYVDSVSTGLNPYGRLSRFTILPLKLQGGMVVTGWGALSLNTTASLEEVTAILRTGEGRLRHNPLRPPDSAQLYAFLFSL